MNVQKISVPVLIVGGGPTGLVASRLLSNFGIAHVLVERRTGPQLAPAAHVINRRTLEILRQCGMPMDSIYALDKHGEVPLDIRWSTDPRAPELGRLKLESAPSLTGDQSSLSQERIANISQSEIEKVLSAEAAKGDAGAIRYGHQWQRFVDAQESCSEITDPEGKTYRINAAYTLAADGAGSPIRRALGIGKQGPDSVATFLSLSCAVDVSNMKCGANTLLTWCLDPQLSGVAIIHDPEKLTVYMRRIHEPYETLEDFDDAVCRRLLDRMFGAGVPCVVTHKDIWRMTAQISDRFRHGRVFLIGDSAHRFPPTGGLGLNSGVADAHNLVWKIAAHIGGAPDSLLDSYEQERMPVVQRNCDTSLNNFLKLDEVISAIGLDPTKASIPAKILASPIVRRLPKRLRSMLFSVLVFPARRALAHSAEDTPRGMARRELIQQAIDRQRMHFDMPGLELGYVYRFGCAVNVQTADTPDNPVGTYAPVARTGTRFPHVSLLDDEGRDSTLDYFRYDSYTLIYCGDVDLGAAHETFGMSINFVDADTLQPADAGISLRDKLEFDECGWILVRPDGHVASRSAPKSQRTKLDEEI